MLQKGARPRSRGSLSQTVAVHVCVVICSASCSHPRTVGRIEKRVIRVVLPDDSRSGLGANSSTAGYLTGWP